MRFSIRVLILAVCLISSAYSQTPTPAPAQSPANPDQPATPDHSLESYVVEELRTQYRFENDGTGRRETYARIRIQSEAGVQQWGQVVVGYNSASERIEFPFVRVLKKDGSKVDAPTDSIQDLSAPIEREAPVYTDFRQKHVPVSGLRPGEVLEYDIIDTIHTAMAPGQFWAQHNFDDHGIVLAETLEIDTPASRVVKLKTKTGMDPKIAETNGRKIYRWTHSHLQSDDEDDDAKKSKDKKKKKSKKDLEQSDVQLTTFPDWDAVGHWYADLERDRRIPTPEIRAKAEELTKDAHSDTEKVQALYDYVAKNFRYVSLSLGMGRYQPHAAADIFHNQYGDCKDKNNLLAAMLEAKGIHSSSVLINSSRKLDPDVPSPMQFDHAITMVPLGSQQIWLDTTTEIAPFQLLSANLRDKKALVIASTGKSELQSTPPESPTPQKGTQDVDGRVNDLGKLEAHVRFVAQGDGELVLRMLFRRTPQAKWQKFMEAITGYLGLAGDITNLKVSDIANTREPLEISFDFAKDNFIDWSTKKSEIALPLFDMRLPAADEDADPADAEPVKLGGAGQHRYHLRLELPAKYTIHSPVPISVTRDYAAYEAVYKLEKNVFTAERTMTFRRYEVSVADTPNYIAFRRAMMADSAQKLGLETTVAGTPSLPKDVTADDLNTAGREALNSGSYQLAVDVLKQAVEKDPKHKFAWNNLGLAYLGLQQTEEAIRAFQKQAELNPYDEFAYNNLGRAYAIQRKYDDAIAQFRKQIEVNPLDKYAHANLGGILIELKKYDEAVPELEKSAALSSDDAFAQIQLGVAHLNLGHDENALTAFDRAVEISATPVVWNNIAYQLSLKQSHLDKARQYAESAIASVAASLRNVRLEQLTRRELYLVPSISAYWDTLGWVYFASNDLENAERYVSASWNIDPRAETGDHLAQIYQKKGQQSLAIQTYARALASRRPELETRPRLASLLGGDAKVDREVEKARSDLQRMRTVPLKQKNGLNGHADFLVLLEPAAKGMTVSATKFVSGDDKLKLEGDSLLRSADFQFSLPDSTPTKVFLRGTLTCPQSPGECAFVWTLPDDVRSVD